MPYGLQVPILIFSRANILQGTCQRFAPWSVALGRADKTRPSGKRPRCRGFTSEQTM